MSTVALHNILLKDILANPGDDTPRLVYADWLEEHSDLVLHVPKQATEALSEFIRAEISAFKKDRTTGGPDYANAV